MDTDDKGSTDSTEAGEAGLPETMDEPPGPTDSTDASGEGFAVSSGENEGSADSTGTGEGWAGEGWADTKGDDEAPAEIPMETEDEGLAPSPAAEDEGMAPSERVGYLVFPDNTEQPISLSQWLIGRADLAKYLSDPEKAPEISRGHLTVFQEGEKFFIEDGKTMVQDKPSSNKTWLVREGTRILVTGTGRNELQDDDEIDVAELVKLQFVEK